MKENMLLLEGSKNKIYKYMTSVSKNVYTDKLDNMVNKYINTLHSTLETSWYKAKHVY